MSCYYTTLLLSVFYIFRCPLRNHTGHQTLNPNHSATGGIWMSEGGVHHQREKKKAELHHFADVLCWTLNPEFPMLGKCV